MVFEVNYDMKSIEVSLVSAAHARHVAKTVSDPLSGLPHF